MFTRSSPSATAIVDPRPNTATLAANLLFSVIKFTLVLSYFDRTLPVHGPTINNKCRIDYKINATQDINATVSTAKGLT